MVASARRAPTVLRGPPTGLNSALIFAVEHISHALRGLDALWLFRTRIRELRGMVLLTRTSAFFLRDPALISSTTVDFVDGSRGSRDVVFARNEEPPARFRLVSGKVRGMHEVCLQNSEKADHESHDAQA